MVAILGDFSCFTNVDSPRFCCEDSEILSLVAIEFIRQDVEVCCHKRAVSDHKPGAAKNSRRTADFLKRPDRTDRRLDFVDGIREQLVVSRECPGGGAS